MALKYGDQLTDVSDDEAELAAVLTMARAREDQAPDDYGLDGGPGGFLGGFEADPDPGFAGENLEDRLFPESAFTPPSGRGPSARLKKDIKAKTALFLTAGGSVLKARDEYCGTKALEAVPDVADALTEIFVDSPDVVRWFTASGKWMKYLDLVTALQPVGAAFVRHHITHQEEQTDKPADWSAYAAG